MNPLVNPFGATFPERVDCSIDASVQCLKFNGSRTSRFAGSMIGIGRTDGSVAVLDLETRSYVRYLEGHVKAITSLCWSRNARYLLSGSRDWNVIVWDISTGDRRDTVRFDGPVVAASFHPQNSKLLLATIAGQAEATLIDLRRAYEGRWDLNIYQFDQGEDGGTDVNAKKRKEVATMAAFNPRGDLIYVGSSLGRLHVFDTQTKNHLYTEVVSSGSSIKSFEFNGVGDAIVINSNDRCIRVYAVDQLAFLSIANSTYAPSPPRAETPSSAMQLNGLLTLQHKFQDLVNRTPWNAVRFSNDGDYVVGGAGHKTAHQIYLWDRNNGSLVKILEGPKDCLDDMDWHPLRSIVITASDQGFLHIWTTNVIDRWSAYAPGFEELEENLEYQEKEDEFDIEDEASALKRKLDILEARVDVLATDSESTVGGGLHRDGTQYLEQYLASSTDWALDDPDSDDDEMFTPGDVDLDEFELDERNLAAVGSHVADIGLPSTRR